MSLEHFIDSYEDTMDSQDLTDLYDAKQAKVCRNQGIAHLS